MVILCVLSNAFIIAVEYSIFSNKIVIYNSQFVGGKCWNIAGLMKPQNLILSEAVVI